MILSTRARNHTPALRRIATPRTQTWSQTQTWSPGRPRPGSSHPAPNGEDSPHTDSPRPKSPPRQHQTSKHQLNPTKAPTFLKNRNRPPTIDLKNSPSFPPSSRPVTHLDSPDQPGKQIPPPQTLSTQIRNPASKLSDSKPIASPIRPTFSPANASDPPSGASSKPTSPPITTLIPPFHMKPRARMEPRTPPSGGASPQIRPARSVPLQGGRGRPPLHDHK